MKELTKKYLINGPNNVFRLSNGKKIIYLFIDSGNNISHQRECNLNTEFETIDFDKLIFKFMKYEHKCEYDIFIEQNDNYNTSKNNIYRENYFDQFNKFINSKINIINNKIVTVNKYSNFRFHFYNISGLINSYKNIISYISLYNPTRPPYNLFILNNYIDIHKKIIKDLVNYKKFLDTSKHIIINKIKNLYSNIAIKTIITKIIEDILLININNAINNTHNIIKTITDMINKLDDIYRYETEYYTLEIDIYIKIIINCLLITNCFIYLSIIFCLRRMLDKDYINNIILYASSVNGQHFIYILIKYFDFKITHQYYKHKDFNINNLHQYSTNNFQYLDILNNNIIVFDDILYSKQCIDLFSFPLNFT